MYRRITTGGGTETSEETKRTAKEVVREVRREKRVAISVSLLDWTGCWTPWGNAPAQQVKLPSST